MVDGGGLLWRVQMDPGQVSFKSLNTPNTCSLSDLGGKHNRNFSLDVHPYMLTIRKPKVETVTVTTAALSSEHPLDTVFIEGTHTIVHVSTAITGNHLLVSWTKCIVYPARSHAISCSCARTLSIY